ncbi:hypothetical protein GCM10022223_06330 [Kineosporia mesophila]|uniref:Kinase n=1 Tax=Kineosporia mesophila TaxID=566012 RepID=A0ABP6Z2T9_9ACTN|nr:ATP-binding protein [Kineosporia mesophila]MCD5351014.1 ATP-binding protein [Kineosporia mesophila]
MARVVFMCGPAGSGKSTFARQLEGQGMVRLSFDVELWQRGFPGALPPGPVRAEVESDLKDRLVKLVSEGRDVVLDFSFWSRAMRDDYRSLLEPFVVVPETIYLATDRETVLRRVRDRRGVHADDAVLSEELAARYFDGFEVPTETEGPLRVIHPV